MSSIKLKSMPTHEFYYALQISIFLLIIYGVLCLIDLLGGISLPQYVHAIILPCVIGSIWIIFLISLFFLKTIYIDRNEIKVKRLNKVLWSISIDNIDSFIYHELKWWHFIIPVEAWGSGELLFRLKYGKISRHFCSLSRRQIKKILNLFEFKLEIIH